MTRFAIITATLLASVSTAVAADTPTIDKIKERGEIVIGHRPASPPFGYIADNGEITGYSVEICKYIAQQIKQDLNQPDLLVRFVTVDAANRIPLVQNGTIDMECAGTGNTVERKKVVSFTYNTIYTATQILVKKGGPIKSVQDLKGRRVAVPQGTAQQKMLDDLDKKLSLGVIPVMAKDAAEEFMLLQTGRAEAAINGPLELANHIAKSKDPAGYEYLPDWESPPEQISVMIAKGDEEFKKLADKGLKKMMTTGEFTKNYSHWFEVPPYNLPMPAALKAQIANPNDKAIGE